MSPLRALTVRSDRREGGRHGRPGSRPLSSARRPPRTASSRTAPRTASSQTVSSRTVTPADIRIRPQLLRTAVLPTLVTALSGAIAVVFAIHSAAPRPSSGLWAVMTASAVLAIASVAAAAMGADRLASSVHDRCTALRRSTVRGQADLRAVVEQLRRGGGLPARPASAPVPPDGDEFDLLAQELSRSHETAVVAVVQASRLSSSVGNEQKVEVFVNLARRLQSLVHREIQLLDELENGVEDPDLLKGLFNVDHLATRIRRHAENLAVLGGAVSRRQWSKPVIMTEVLRSAIAEVEQYPRVKLVPPIDGTLQGHAVADVIHLLAELVENATLFSAPHTQVLLRAQHVTAGLAVEVDDRGLGMPVGEQDRMNALLADPDQVNVAQLLQDGRIGLFVVAALARRHGIAVRLQPNIYGGVQAVLVLPQRLLGAEPDAETPGPAVSSSAARPVHVSPGSVGSPGAGPLPVRGEQRDRPNPAAAVPGVNHSAPSATGPSPGGVVRGTMGRPQLPRRRSQEHLVPQLRAAPPPRNDDDDHPLHDPGLMAAFQRGIGLAESQPVRDPAPASPAPENAAPQRHDNQTPKE
ncbi:sensor histidine kinase [Streptomyces sp. NPDC052236]|uniref:sensor histidine kinase n=1 Tax=Streptomyces sp. NPDC052236 TaxID=3365686 RepID=UPI0037D37CF2